MKENFIIDIYCRKLYRGYRCKLLSFLDDSCNDCAFSGWCNLFGQGTSSTNAAITDKGNFEKKAVEPYKVAWLFPFSVSKSRARKRCFANSTLHLSHCQNYRTEKGKDSMKGWVGLQCPHHGLQTPSGCVCVACVPQCRALGTCPWARCRKCSCLHQCS